MKALVVVVGSAIVLAETGIAGYLVHRWLLDHAAGIAVWIPRDAGAVAGLLAGAAIVGSWLG